LRRKHRMEFGWLWHSGNAGAWLRWIVRADSNDA
jgi:hypothetical protein